MFRSPVLVECRSLSMYQRGKLFRHIKALESGTWTMVYTQLRRENETWQVLRYIVLKRKSCTGVNRLASKIGLSPRSYRAQCFRQLASLTSFVFASASQARLE